MVPNRIMVTSISFFLIEKTILLWDGIVAPGVEWIASQYSPGGHGRSLKGAIFIHSLISIMGTGWIKSAGVCRHSARKGHLIKPNQCKDSNARPINNRTR